MKRDDKFTLELTAAELLKVFVVMGRANGACTGSCAYEQAKSILGLQDHHYVELVDTLSLVHYYAIQGKLEGEFFSDNFTDETMESLLEDLEGTIAKIKRLSKGM